MTVEHFYVVKITVPVSTGSCTIAGNPGYGTPRTCTDQLNDGTLTTTNREYVFTTASDERFYDGVDRKELVTNVEESLPMIRNGLGLGSRATAKITFRDQSNDDPNLDSPALVANPTIANQGFYLSKFFARNTIKNKTVVVEKYKYEGGVSTLINSNSYLGRTPQYQGKNIWVLECSDMLSRIEFEDVKYPPRKGGSVTLDSDITSGQSIFTVTSTEQLFSSDFDYVRVENDVMPVTNAVTAGGMSWTLTVDRTTSFTISAGATERVFSNVSSDHSAGEEVFICRLRTGDLAATIIAIFDNAGIPSSSYNVGNINIELNNWLPYPGGAWLFVEQYNTNDLLSMICETYSLDIFTEDGDFINVFANSPWKEASRVLLPGEDYDYHSLKWSFDEAKRYTRALLSYNKARIGFDDDEKNYNKFSGAVDSVEEGELLNDGEKQYRFEPTLFLGSSQQDQEIADTTTVRFVQRWTNPISGTVEMTEYQFERNGGLKTADVIEIQDPELAGFDGLPLQLKAQVSRIVPQWKNRIGRVYKVMFTAYNPSSAIIGDQPVVISETQDLNLYTLAGSPTQAQSRVFIIDNLSIGQLVQSQGITTGLGWPSGSTINLVVQNGSFLDGKGGNGGAGGATSYDPETDTWQPQNGSIGNNGGVAIRVQSDSITLNVYIGGVRNIDSVNYTCEGTLRAPGGGDSGFDAVNDQAGDGGNGGIGNSSGNAGSGGVNLSAPLGEPNGSNGLPNINSYGVDGVMNGSSAAGSAGFGIQDDSTGSTIGVYTDGNPSRYIRSSGETNYTVD
jgi:hypothetical protein